MPQREMTVEEAVDIVSEATREVGAAHASLVSRVPGREAERLAISLGYESKQMGDALIVLRKHIRSLDDFSGGAELLRQIIDKIRSGGDNPSMSDAEDLEELANKLDPKRAIFESLVPATVATVESE